MNILLSTDDNYVMPTGVLMHSIGVNNDSDIDYYIIVNQNFNNLHRSQLESIAAHYGNRICFYYIDDEVTKIFPFKQENMPTHVTIATYYRLLITKLLPDGVSKILYLDGDMIVRKPLTDLWNIDISKYALGAVHDQDEYEHIHECTQPYPKEYGYFNAGMLLINVEFWRRHDCMTQFMDYIKDHTKEIVFHDQDVLNAVLYNQIKWLNVTYNFQSGFLYEHKDKFCAPDLYAEIEASMQDPTIIHYTTGVKPWNVCCTHPQRWVWRHYKSLSQWKDMKLEVPKATSLHQFIKNWAFRLGLQENNTTLYRRIILKQ